MAEEKKRILLEYQARATGFKEVFDQVQKLVSGNKLDLGKNFEASAKKLENGLRLAINQIDKEVAQGNLTKVNSKQIEQQLTQIMTSLRSMVSKVLSETVAPELKEQFEKAQTELDAALKSQKTARGKYGGYKQQLVEEGGKTQLSERAERGLFNNFYGSEIKGKNLDIGGGKMISSVQDIKNLQQPYEQIKQKIQEAGSLEKASLTETEKTINELYSKWTTAYNNRITQLRSDIATAKSEYEAATTKVGEAQTNVTNIGTNLQAADKKSVASLESSKKIMEKLTDEQIKFNNNKTESQEVLKGATNATNDNNVSMEKGTKTQEKNTTVVGKAIKNTLAYGTTIRLFRRIFTKTISTIKELDKALTNMAVVTRMSREETWQMVGTMQNMADELGTTSTEVAKVMTMFYQQGKTTTQVTELTTAAIRAAKIAGIDATESVNLLTNAMNGFQMSASQATEVTDKFAALAASAATNYEELATALSKVAAQANLAGMSMDFTLGLLTKGIETTREAPETIGTALKTVISRMRELTDYGKTLEDGVDVNRVAKALSNIGVELMDEQGQFRDLDAVLTEVGRKWDSLNKNQQANVAVALAGTRCRREMACAWAA